MTYSLSRCPSCEHAAVERRDALISPFIAHYVLNQRPSRCCLMKCAGCDLIFFSERLTADEISKLYDSYRGTTYFAARHAVEPWYSRAYNDDLGGEKEIQVRQSIYRRSLEPSLASGIETVLDYGGDRGQLMPGGPGKSHAVYDLSGVEPVAGAEPIRSEEALAGREFDLVLMCHIVEHFSEPLEQTIAVTKFVRRGGLLYVEVPYERFPLHDIPNRGWYRRYLDFISKSPLLLLLIDFWSTAVRVKFSRIPPLGFVKLHEHLNSFNQQSLRRLLEGAGMEVMTCAVAPEIKVVVAVCRRP